jgi:hypothetical protein
MEAVYIILVSFLEDPKMNLTRSGNGQLFPNHTLMASNISK